MKFEIPDELVELAKKHEAEIGLLFAWWGKTDSGEGEVWIVTCGMRETRAFSKGWPEGMVVEAEDVVKGVADAGKYYLEKVCSDAPCTVHSLVDNIRETLDSSVFVAPPEDEEERAL